jgi:hypothetical protein
MTTAYISSIKTPVANKSASLIYYLYGNSPFETLFQETLKLKKAMEGYSFKVLLKPEELPSWIDLSEKDEKLADVKALPTRTNLFKYLIELTQDGYYIDLFLFTHGWEGQFGKLNKSSDEDRVTTADIERELSVGNTGFQKIPIRIVWGTNCYGHTLGAAWRSVGAKATAGACQVNFYPNAFGNFIDDWNKGNVSFESAVRGSDTDLVRTAVQTWVRFVDAPKKKKEGKWSGCPGLNTVLGDHACAKDYFDTWLGKGEWQDGQSGKENMNHSSFMLIGGDKDITKNTRTRWP